MFEIGDVVKIIKNSYDGHEDGTNGIIAAIYNDECYYIEGLCGKYMSEQMIHHHSDLKLINYGG